MRGQGDSAGEGSDGGREVVSMLAGSHPPPSLKGSLPHSLFSKTWETVIYLVSSSGERASFSFGVWDWVWDWEKWPQC